MWVYKQAFLLLNTKAPVLCIVRVVAGAVLVHKESLVGLKSVVSGFCKSAFDSTGALWSLPRHIFDMLRAPVGVARQPRVDAVAELGTFVKACTSLDFNQSAVENLALFEVSVARPESKVLAGGRYSDKSQTSCIVRMLSVVEAHEREVALESVNGHKPLIIDMKLLATPEELASLCKWQVLDNSQGWRLVRHVEDSLRDLERLDATPMPMEDASRRGVTLCHSGRG